MQPVLNVEDVKRVELALKRAGVSVADLMRRAGAAAAQELAHLDDVHNVCVLVGFGNNGGDGWVAAEELLRAGFAVQVVSPVQPSQIKSDLALMVAKSASDAGVEIVVAPPRGVLERIFIESDVVLDAMLGTGFHGAPAAPFDAWIETLNSSGTRVVSVDVPSGLSAQTGHAPGGCVIADVTVTMLALKPGLLADEGRDACGAIVVAPLSEQTERLVLEADPVAWRIELPDYLDVIQAPTCAVDKHSRGHVLVVGGSSRYPGAAVMSARAAARAGAGYVSLVVPESIAALVQTQLPEVPVVALPADEQGFFAEGAQDLLASLLSHVDAVLIGPGMGVTAATVAMCSKLLAADVPLVMDADGLNCLARLTNNRLDQFPELIRRAKPLILTPHKRELGRLMGLPDTPPDSLTSCLEAARRIVWADGGSELVIVAKGTATACVSVESALLPKPGPATLATAGSGDVLAGVMLAQLAHAAELDNAQLALACAFACEVHGFAGSVAAERFGSRGAMASDIVDSIGLASDIVEERAAYASAPVLDELAAEESPAPADKAAVEA